jgi:hypothetical protein
VTASTLVRVASLSVFRRWEYCQALWCPFLYGIAYTSPFSGAAWLARASMRPEAEQR